MIKYTVFSFAVAATLIGAALFVTVGNSTPFAHADAAFCGDGVVNQPSEQCDGTTGCTSGCVYAFCGDGVVNQPAEQCDGSAGVTSGYTCTSGCILAPVNNAPFCGDGVVNQPAEECDGGSNCTSGCKLATAPPSGCTSNCGGGGGGGGGYVKVPKLDVMQYGAIPHATRNANAVLAIVIKSIGTQPSENVQLVVSLPSDLSYTGGPVTMTRTLGTSVTTGTAPRDGGNIHIYNTLYQDSFSVGTLAVPEDAVLFIPLHAENTARLGLIPVEVFARKTNGFPSERDTKATVYVLVATPSVVYNPPRYTPPVTKKPAPKPAPKAVVAKPAPKVCISAEEYARLTATSTLAQSSDNNNTNGLLAAVGGLFDLGTGSTCFGLIILLLIILALVIIARLLYHYFEDEAEHGEGDGQLPLIQE